MPDNNSTIYINDGNTGDALSGEKKNKNRKIHPVFIIAGLALFIGAGIGTFFLFFSQPPRTSTRLPYSVLVSSYESLDDANQTAQRLKKMDVNAYVIKKLKEGGNFSMDVHAGAFKEPEKAEELKRKLKGMGLDDAEILNFNEINKEISEFEKLGEKEKKEFILTDVQIPELSEAVIKNIAFFPVDRNFRVMSLKIEDCAYNLEKITSITVFAFNPEIIPEGMGMDELLKQSKAVSQAVYEDKLFGYHVGITISSANNAEELCNSILEKNKGKAGIIKKELLEYKTGMGTLKGKLFEKSPGVDEQGNSDMNNAAVSGESAEKESENKEIKKEEEKEEMISQFTYISFIPESNHLLIMNTNDCPEKNFMELITRGGNENGLLYFPEVRKNLYVLPRVAKEEKLYFSCYDFDTVKQEYAEQRNNKDWAKNIVGNYLSCSYYIKDEKDCFSVSFFNLNFSTAAKNVHTVFMNEKKAEDYGAATNVHSSEGWYLDSITSNELSFAYGSYIIALNLYNEFNDEKYMSMEYDEMQKAIDALKEQRLALMQKYADTLQIWDKQETKEKVKDTTL